MGFEPLRPIFTDLSRILYLLPAKQSAAGIVFVNLAHCQKRLFLPKFFTADFSVSFKASTFKLGRQVDPIG